MGHLNGFQASKIIPVRCKQPGMCPLLKQIINNLRVIPGHQKIFLIRSPPGIRGPLAGFDEAKNKDTA